MRLKPIIIIPARYNSSRFPGKMLEKLGDKTVLEQTIETGKRTGLPVYLPLMIDRLQICVFVLIKNT